MGIYIYHKDHGIVEEIKTKSLLICKSPNHAKSNEQCYLFPMKNRKKTHSKPHWHVETRRGENAQIVVVSVVPIASGTG
jgi:hypothetical protein